MPSPNGLSPSVAHCPRSDRRARAAAAVSHVAVAAAIMLLWRRHGSNVLVEKTAGKKRHFARGGRRRMGGGVLPSPALRGDLGCSAYISPREYKSSPFVAVRCRLWRAWNVVVPVVPPMRPTVTIRRCYRRHTSPATCCKRARRRS